MSRGDPPVVGTVTDGDTGHPRILAGQTMTLDFDLERQVIEAEGIVATMEREPLIVRDILP